MIARIAAPVAAIVPALWAGLIVGAGFLAVPAVFAVEPAAKPFAYGAAARVFDRLATGEWIAALVLILALAPLGLPRLRTIALIVVVVLLAFQATWLRPELAERAAALAAGREVASSPAHAIYATLELFKLAWLLALAYGGWRAARSPYS